MEEITFSASLPEIQSAVSIGGDGARVKIDVPDSDIAAVMRLAAFGRGKELLVTVREANPHSEPENAATVGLEIGEG